MRKQIKVTKMVYGVVIMSHKENNSNSPKWNISLVTEPIPELESDLGTFYAVNFESPDEINQIEPGMYVTFVYYAHNASKLKTLKAMRAENLFINKRKTEKKRDLFDFKETKSKRKFGVSILKTPKVEE